MTVDHQAAESTAGGFHFATVASPRARSAATGAAFTVVDGTADHESAPLGALHDGKLPEEEDQPDANFFFVNGSDGGRLLVDLGKPIPVQEVDTYSRHTDARAPQVYKLYASTGEDPGFVAQPHRPQDPATAGWKLVATVDTRTKFGGDGGQYGVSVTEPTAGLLGEYRYLLFDVAQTQADDPFGNTFFSEINVVDRDAPPAPPITIEQTKKTFTYDQKGYHLVFTNDDPSFDPKEQERLVQTFFQVYPPMAEEFNKHAAKEVKISIEKGFRTPGAVAATQGNVIHCNPAWFRQHPEDIDVITHEGMHVVQAYRQWDPAWLREGLADYARQKYGVNNAAADWSLPDYRPKQSYKDAYRVTARFLVWLEKNVKPGIAVALDGALREGNYQPETWNALTGKGVDELWQDYGKNPAL